MRGRKPKPTLLKVIEGNRGRRPLNDEPIPPGALLATAPPWMTRAQKVAWRSAIASAPEGLLRRLDRSVLAAWIIACDLHEQAARKIARQGLVVAGRKGQLVQSPYVKILNQEAALMLKCVAELGFSPSSRGRVSYAPSGEAAPEDPEAEFFEA